MVLGYCDRNSADLTRGMAQETLGKVAGGGDPEAERTEARGIPLLRVAFEEFVDATRPGL